MAKIQFSTNPDVPSLVDTGGKNKKEIKLLVGESTRNAITGLFDSETIEEAILMILSTRSRKNSTWGWEDVPREKDSAPKKHSTRKKDSAPAPVQDGTIAKTVTLATGPMIRVGTKKGPLQIRLDDPNTAIRNLVAWLWKNNLLDVLKE